jgi:hypothetical protein
MAHISSGPLAPDDDHLHQAADEAARVLSGQRDKLEPATRRFVDALRKATLEAPLHSLAVAFLLGMLIARRR